MKSIIQTGKSILNALVFANAENYSEFRTLLNQIDEKAGRPAGEKLKPAVSEIQERGPLANAIHSLPHAL